MSTLEKLLEVLSQPMANRWDRRPGVVVYVRNLILIHRGKKLNMEVKA